jgi:hypothetical protein
MMKKVLIILAVGIFVAMSAGSAVALEQFVGTAGLLQYDASQAYNGYTMFSPFGQPGGVWYTYLIDMEGNVVHTWSRPMALGLYAHLMESGNIMRGGRPNEAGAANPDGMVSAGGSGGRVEEINWDNETVWVFDWYSNDYRQHHDFQRIWNSNLQAWTTIFLVWERATAAEAIAMGADPDVYEEVNGRKDDGTLQDWSPCYIKEVDMDGNPVWEWHFKDHFMQDVDPGLPDFGVTSEMPGKMDINKPTVYAQGPQRDWNHTNSLYWNAELDHIAVNAKHQSEFYVIDHGATNVGTVEENNAAAAGPAGDFLYRFGAPDMYDQGVGPTYDHAGDQQMYGSHDIQYILPAAWTGGPELPGGGNFLIFDNGCWNPVQSRSVILEINPYIMDGDGNLSATLVNPPDAGYQTMRGAPGPGSTTDNVSNQVVWRYLSARNNSFFSYYISGCQRQPNGNTVIMSGATGHMFEVTEDGEVVWEYINPVTANGVAYSVTDGSSGGHSTFRCYRYGPDHPGLVGRDLTPQGQITDFNNEMTRAQFGAATSPLAGDNYYLPYYP